MAWLRGRKHSKKTRKKMSVFREKYFSNPKFLDKYRDVWSSPSYRKKLSLSLKKYFSNPTNRKKLSGYIKKYYQSHPGFVHTLESIQKIDRALTRWWKEHPSVKKERSEAVKKMFIENPSSFAKFLKYGNNPLLPHFKTKQGFIVRSKGEQKIANFLFENKIKSLYEAKTLVFKKEGQVCVPDFWLPKYKVYIEFYGGHPAAWKKKVMKNKLYKKYKIPCVFITPSELRDLDFYLLKEIKGKR